MHSGVRKLWSDRKRIPMESPGSLVRELNPREGVEPSTPGFRDQSPNHWANQAMFNFVILPKLSYIPLHPGCAKKVTRPKMNAYGIPCQPREGVEPSTPGLRDQCSDHWANEATVDSVILPKSVGHFSVHSRSEETVIRPKTNAEWILQDSWGSRTLYPWFTRPVL